MFTIPNLGAKRPEAITVQVNESLLPSLHCSKIGQEKYFSYLKCNMVLQRVRNDSIQIYQMVFIIIISVSKNIIYQIRPFYIFRFSSSNSTEFWERVDKYVEETVADYVNSSGKNVFNYFCHYSIMM